MRVARVVSEPMSVNVWLVEDAGEALVVDAGLGRDAAHLAAELRRAAGGARFAGIYCTHPHCDHVGGCRALREALGCEVLIHEADVPTLEKGDSVATLGAFLGAQQEPCPARPLREGATLRVGDVRFEVLRLPGHTPDHTALWDPATRTLFSGDVVFAFGAFGRVDFPGGDGAALTASLRRIADLRPAAVYPGHMEPLLSGVEDALADSVANAEAML